MEGQNNSNVAVVMVPFPAQGHLNQLLHLSRLVISYGIQVHYAGSATHNHQAKVRVQGWDSESVTKIQFHDFQLPPYSSPPPNPDISVSFLAHLQPLFDVSTHLRKPVSELLEQLSAKCYRIIVVYDSLMASVVQDVKLIPKAESFRFVPISAFAQFIGFWQRVPETEKPFQVDSTVMIPANIPSREGAFTPEISSFVLDQKKFWGFESGRIYNTSRAIEGRYVELLEKLSGNEHTDTTHFVLGPFHPVEITENQERRHRCLEWLDEHEKRSVIYVSFGSSTSLTVDQMRELATGLETSGQKFLWVLRNADKGDAFNNGEVPELPAGFEDRVKGTGMVVRDWAPQLDILAHRSVGGFMSHCGWNSCIESISMGVAIAAWPMHSDQPRNAVFITEVLRIGVTVKDWEDRGKLVSSDTIESAVKKLMTSKEGEEIRKRASEIGDTVRKSVSKGGASSLEMDAFIAHITR